jgi:hypothetical protein
MDKSHPLFGAELRFIRADRHIRDAHLLIDQFGVACEDHVVTDDNGNIRFSGWPDIPVELPVIVSDAIHNMRAALDYIVFELAKHDSGKVQNGTQFPIEHVKVHPTNPARGFDARKTTYLKGLKQRHIDAIEWLQPYKGVEWTKTLRDISNPDKHRELIVLSSAARSIELVFIPDPDGKFRGQTNVARTELTARYNVKVYAQDAIAIPPSDTPDKPGIMKTLRRLQTEIAGVIELFKPEFKV